MTTIMIGMIRFLTCALLVSFGAGAFGAPVDQEGRTLYSASIKNGTNNELWVKVTYWPLVPQVRTFQNVGDGVWQHRTHQQPVWRYLPYGWWNFQDGYYSRGEQSVSYAFTLPIGGAVDLDAFINGARFPAGLTGVMITAERVGLTLTEGNFSEDWPNQWVALAGSYEGDELRRQIITIQEGDHHNDDRIVAAEATQRSNEPKPAKVFFTYLRPLRYGSSRATVPVLATFSWPMTDKERATSAYYAETLDAERYRY